MSVPVVAIRPEPGCSATAARGPQLGLEIEPWPLFEIESLPWDPPAPEGIDALLLGSANALRCAGPALATFGGKPAYVVGKVTAAAAEAAGFTVAATGRGGLQPVLQTIRPPRTLLRLAGEERMPLRPPLGVLVETRIVYRSNALPMSVALAERLRQGALVLLHSGVAARHFAAECDRLEVPRTAVAIAALGPRIAEAAGDGWAASRAAGEPREAALLALARDMCHEPHRG